MSYARICIGCNNPFETDNFNQKRCHKDCGRPVKDTHRSRKRKSETNDLTFIGVDGEGVGRPDGKHEYVMLSVGDQTLMNPDGSELDCGQIFAFLWEQFLKHKHAAFIGFFLGYDFTQWTKTLPEDAAYQLWSKKAQDARKPKTSKNPDPWPVYWNGWEFDIMTKRRFRLRKHMCVPKKMNATECRICLRELDHSDPVILPGEMEFITPDTVPVDDVPDTDIIDFWQSFIRAPKVNPWMYICDTGSFWQMSLLAALNPKNWPHPIVTDEEYATIKRGKETRSKWIEYGDISDYAEMREYNTLENDVLARMTRELNKGFVEVGLHIRAREWYGPGRAAQTWLDLESKKMPEGYTVMRKDITQEVPEFAREAGRMSYYGGWFEQFYHGHIPGEVEEDDINSAYPWVISELPCLHHGQWTEGTGDPNYRSGSLYILRAEVRGSNPYIGAVPYRTSKGRILRPHTAIGWYWKHELDMARRAGLIDTVEVLEYVAYDPCGCPPPLASIADLYQKRLEVGKETPQGKALKLVYNSSYGKTAQSVGAPKYGNSIYASLITAGCRTRILEAIATHPEGAAAVTMIATDGIYFTSPHPNLDIDKTGLGKWDRKTKRNMTQFMPGVYWTDDLRDVLKKEKETGTKVAANELPSKTRGINVRDLANVVLELDDQFWEFADAIANNRGSWTWPTFSVPVNFDMVSATQAIARGRWETAGVVMTDGERTILSNPSTKRLVYGPEHVYYDGKGIRSMVYPMGDKLESTPYDKHFGEDMNAIIELAGIDTPDGDFDKLWGWAMMRGEFE